MIRLTIDTANAAFEGVAGQEVARILRQLAERIEDDTLEQRAEFTLRDCNGNTVGKAIYTPWRAGLKRGHA